MVRERTGIDFSGYRRAAVVRRIHNRMLTLGLQSLDEYCALMQASENEARHLLERLTIKVSRFYRNAPTFDLLRACVLPDLARRRGPGPLRIWSAGCGYGEEAYSLAMLLEEAKVPGAVEATDIDQTALAVARRGEYARSAAAELPRDLADRFFVTVGSGPDARYIVRDDIRARVRFSSHDFTANAPPVAEPFDLVACRNVLIYLQRDAQARALRVVRSAVAERGSLCLGEAEWPSPGTLESLEVVDRRRRIFRAVACPTRRDAS